MNQKKNNKNTEKILNKTEPENSKLSVFLDWLRTFLIVLTVGVFLTIFVIQRNIIEGPSMEPTLHNKDQIFVEKVSKYFNIKRGDIITIEKTDPFNPQTLLIKRVIGLPGEHLEIKDNHVYINDERLAEPYLAESVETHAESGMDYQNVTLGEDEYFVLGDNRAVSKDSRKIGPVKADQILGKLLFKFYPFNEIGVPK